MNRFFIALLFALFVTSPVHAMKPADEKRLNEIAERGSHVMPFDLEKPIYIFTKTNEGGIQQVIAKDKSDSEQIHLIRKHLLEISAEFSRGNFSKLAQLSDHARHAIPGHLHKHQH